MKEIQTYEYIFSFNKPVIPKEVKIGYCFDRVEQYFPAPLRGFKCHKYGHHRGNCRGCPICERGCQKNPDYMVEDCPNETKCSNCQENHPAFWRSCKIYKKSEIPEITYERNQTFFEARKTIWFRLVCFYGISTIVGYSMPNWGCPRGVMVKAMDCGIVVSEFVLQSRHCVHFRANTLGKGMDPLILPAMG